MAVCTLHGEYVTSTRSCSGCKTDSRKQAKEFEIKVKQALIRQGSVDKNKKVQPISGHNEIQLKSFRTKGKYQNESVWYNGNKYDSKLEARVAEELDYRLKSGEIIEIKRQVRIPLIVNTIKISTYYIDFIYIKKDGTRVYCEVKGFETEVWKMKWKLLTAIIPELDSDAVLEVIKDNKRNYSVKNTKTKVS